MSQFVSSNLTATLHLYSLRAIEPLPTSEKTKSLKEERKYHPSVLLRFYYFRDKPISVNLYSKGFINSLPFSSEFPWHRKSLGCIAVPRAPTVVQFRQSWLRTSPSFPSSRFTYKLFAFLAPSMYGSFAPAKLLCRPSFSVWVCERAVWQATSIQSSDRVVYESPYRKIRSKFCVHSGLSPRLVVSCCFLSPPSSSPGTSWSKSYYCLWLAVE